MTIEFKKFNKIPRWVDQRWILTEKIDGTNACVIIRECRANSVCDVVDDNRPISKRDILEGYYRTKEYNSKLFYIAAQSRQKLIYPGKEDNFGFAQWVEDNKEELVKLGEGYHYGEWWGKGIQRGYGLEERRFSLFDWWRVDSDKPLPSCVHTVPFLGTTTGFVDDFWDLRKQGSKAVEGYMNPEGYILTNVHYHDMKYKVIINKNK